MRQQVAECRRLEAEEQALTTAVAAVKVCLCGTLLRGVLGPCGLGTSCMTPVGETDRCRGVLGRDAEHRIVPFLRLPLGGSPIQRGPMHWLSLWASSSKQQPAAFSVSIPWSSGNREACAFEHVCALFVSLSLSVCVCMCVCACVRACARACVRVQNCQDFSGYFRYGKNKTKNRGGIFLTAPTPVRTPLPSRHLAWGP